MKSEAQETLIIAGASGFVGSNLRRALAGRFHFRAITRSQSLAQAGLTEWNTDWVQADMFSLPQMEKALAGAGRRAIYLVHSMLPSARLNQSRFDDLDLLLADNFARAAAAGGVEEIIFLGGLIPAGPRTSLSPHLRSRLEVEEALAARGATVTVLRAGVIVGPGGSSLRMLVNLIRRLPVMILPGWVRSRTRCLSIEDLIRATRFVLEDSSLAGGTYDLSGPDALTYETMIRQGAQAMGLRRHLFTLPIRSVGVSKLWIRIFSGAPVSLVDPLVDSLRHNLDARPNPLQARIEADALTFPMALKRSLDGQGRLLPNPRERTQTEDNRLIRTARRVRSVQRLPLPPGMRAAEVAEVYFRWLAHFFAPLIDAERRSDGGYCLRLFPLSVPLLELAPSDLTPEADRKVYYIRGGFLANTRAEPPGRFEFREVMNGREIITAIHAYQPRLPWHFYNLTQALLHLYVMRAFGAFLQGTIRRETS